MPAAGFEPTISAAVRLQTGHWDKPTANLFQQKCSSRVCLQNVDQVLTSLNCEHDDQDYSTFPQII